MDKIAIDGEWFVNDKGSRILFRGSNISPKIPCSPQSIFLNPEMIQKHREVSFVGTPFPVEEADEHFRRLRFWGFNCLRYTVTWEAVEHRGPGKYDEEFLDYLAEIIAIAAKHELYVFIDIHQDVWCRFTGGCGAPGWTLELAGFDLANLEKTGAAFLPKINEDPMNHLLWVTNAYKLATATMFTLFFAGETFAPNCKVEGENIQHFLQRHYFNTLSMIARSLAHLPNVIGVDIMNEPLSGYIGWKDLRELEGLFCLGLSPTPFQSMLLGMGEAQVVEYWKKWMFGIKNTGLRLFDPEGTRAWQEGRECIWKEHKVWDYNKKNVPVLLQPDYFSFHRNRRINFTEDFYRPFIKEASLHIRKILPSAILFVENEVNKKPPKWGIKDPENIALSTHWYDNYVLALKKFHPFIGYDFGKRSWLLALPSWMRRFFAMQIRRLKEYARDRMGKVPTIISEFGIAFDMDNRKSYRTGNYSKQVLALNRSFQAIEDNILSCTIWNYFPSHNCELGDKWNNEDLSIFSPDLCDDEDAEDPYWGARARESLIRPYPVATPGTLKYMNFDMKKKMFEVMFTSEQNIKEPLEIFLPQLHFKKELTVVVSDGRFERDIENQRFYYHPSQGASNHFIRIRGLSTK